MMRWQVLVSLIGLEVVYLVFGGLVFSILESRDTTDADHTAARDHINISQLIHDFVSLNNNSCSSVSAAEALLQYINERTFTASGLLLVTPADNSTSTNDSSSRWDLAASIFFAMTVVSTIGYGNLVPTTVGSRAFCCLYALCGIPLTLVMMVAIGGRLNSLASRLDQRIAERQSRLGKVGRSVILFSVGFLLFILLPSAMFSLVDDWSYGVSVYYSIVTLTTIGFGDFVAGCDNSHPVYRVAVGLWIYVGLAWLSGFIASVQDNVQSVVTHVDSLPPIISCSSCCHHSKQINQQLNEPKEQNVELTSSDADCQPKHRV